MTPQRRPIRLCEKCGHTKPTDASDDDDGCPQCDSEEMADTVHNPRVECPECGWSDPVVGTEQPKPYCPECDGFNRTTVVADWQSLEGKNTLTDKI